MPVTMRRRRKRNHQVGPLVPSLHRCYFRSLCTHTHILSPSPTHAHTLSFPPPPPPTCTYPLLLPSPHTHTLSFPPPPPPTHAQTLSFPLYTYLHSCTALSLLPHHTLLYTHTRTHTHTSTHTHTRTHTHTQSSQIVRGVIPIRPSTTRTMLMTSWGGQRRMRRPSLRRERPGLCNRGW